MIVLLIFSCSSKDRKVDTHVLQLIDFKKLDTVIPFTGYWISECYLNNIKKNKSPRLAQIGSQSIYIPERTLKQTVMIYNFHEGEPSKILKNGIKYQLYNIENDSVFEHPTDIQILSSTKIKINDTSFIKIYPVDNSKILEEILFKGQYTNETGINIEFKKNGEIIGFNKNKYYQPKLDYAGDEGLNIDQIGFGETEKKLQWFSFKFINDTLELHKLKCVEFDSTSHNCGIVDFGELVYKFWKKK